MPHSFTDIQIIEGLLSRDTTLCNQIAVFLYSDNNKSISHFVLNNSGSLQDAEDLFQDSIITFMNQVWQKKYQLQDDTKLSTYFFAIAKNNWLKKLERDGKKYNWDLQFLKNQSEIISNDSAIEIMIEKEEIESSWTIFNQLGELCKKVLTAYYFEEKTMEEIALTFGFTNAQTAKTRKFRCMQDLRNLLG